MPLQTAAMLRRPLLLRTLTAATPDMRTLNLAPGAAVQPQRLHKAQVLLL